jgi:hypothetical protein
MNYKLAIRVRAILDQEHIMHSLHKINTDDYEIHWIKMSEGPTVEVVDSGTITNKTKIAYLPFGD